MRREYVSQLVAFLKSTPQSPENLQDLKEKALLWGATEDEFTEAVQQTGLAPDTINPSTNHTKDEKKIIKKLLEFDLALHGVLLLMLGLLAVFFLNAFPRSTDVATQQAFTKEAKPLIPPVYAKSVAIDAQEVFSYPQRPITLAISGTPKKEIYGYFPYWMLDNQSNISLDTITTLSYFGLSVDGTGSIITRNTDGTLEKGWQSWSSPQLQQLIQRAKQKNIHLELTLKSFNNENIETLVASDKAQKTFINNAVQLVQSKAFDGVNLDFEYIGTPDPTTKEHFTRLVKNLKAELRRQIPGSTLTISTYINEAAIPRLVDIEALSDDVESFVVMGYDFHTPSGSAGPVAPLDGPVSIIGYMQSYLEKVPADKLILTLPHYGYDWEEGKTEKSAHRIIPYAVAGEESKNHSVQWDEVTQTPWYTYTDPVTQSKRIVYFENVRSLGLKYDYINKKDLRGVGIWALGYEGSSSELQLLQLEKFVQN